MVNTPSRKVIPQDRLWELAAGQTTVITVNRRLSRHLLNGFAARQEQRGLQAWGSPDIVPWSAWLHRCFEQAVMEQGLHGRIRLPMLLSPEQEGLIWESVISRSPSGQELFSSRTASRLARQAWTLIQEWTIGRTTLSQSPTPETEAFLTWAREFEDLLQTSNWLDQARLPDLVGDLFQSGQLNPPTELILAGFDEFSPQQSSLLARLQDMQTSLLELRPPDFSSRCRRVSLPDPEAEIRTAARWVRGLLDDQTSQRIGVIVPDISRIRTRIAATFQEILHPEQRLGQADQDGAAFNISLGPGLSEEPVVRTGLLMFWLTGDPVDIHVLSEICRSPFLAGWASESSARALVDAHVRERGESSIPHSLLGSLLDRAHGQLGSMAGCPTLIERIQEFLSTVRAWPKSQLPSVWARDLSSASELLGWPGDQGLSSHEHQALAAYRQVLQRFSRLDLISGPMTLKRAAGLISRLCSETAFQPQSPDVPVQIMGPLEAAGLSFDHLWVMGLSGESWPPPPRPNPLLPGWLQHSLNLPHASASRELAFARSLTGRMLSSSPEIMISWPAQEQGLELEPSPLILDLPLTTVQELDLPPDDGLWTQIRQTRQTETLDDDLAPPLDCGTHLHGGTSFFRAQAVCPFRGFAEHRLLAAGIETPTPGMDARMRGILVHTALDALWSELKHQANLADLSQQARDTVIQHAANSALNRAASRWPATLNRHIRALEQVRLERLLAQWLELDRQRPPFRVVQLERSSSLEIEGLSLTLQADRIDVLEDGRAVIIDYKTGRPSLASWFDDRVSEPQLPLYVLSVSRDVAGVAFAQVGLNRSRFLGVAAEEDILPGVKPLQSLPEALPWDRLLESWREKLSRLALEIRQGFARVEPQQGTKSCRSCGLQPLCRIHEHRLEPASEDLP